MLVTQSAHLDNSLLVIHVYIDIELDTFCCKSVQRNNREKEEAGLGLGGNGIDRWTITLETHSIATIDVKKLTIQA